MGGFSKPWRRKIGTFTLLMACILMAADCCDLCDDNGPDFSWKAPDNHVRVHADAAGNYSYSMVIVAYRFPAWTLAIPLFLLSACLLLSQPTKPSQAPSPATPPEKLSN